MEFRFFSEQEIIDCVGQKTGTVIKHTDTGSLVFTNFGARLLGLFPSRHDPNTLWIAHNISDRITSNHWLTGGERLWIAPQRNFFFENPRDFDGFHVSPEIDPGLYNQVSELTYENSFSLLDYIDNRIYNNSIARRRFSVIDDPYKSGLDYAGVLIREHLSIPAQKLEVCPWSLAMVITAGPDQPGTSLFPIRNNSNLLSYFDPIPSDRAKVENGYARFLIDSKYALKLAIRPEDTIWENPAKVIYLSPFPGESRWFCLVKRSDDLPRTQEECVDLAASDPSGPKGAIQAYNHGCDEEGEIHSYGEIELQLNKGKLLNGSIVSEASHELLGYAGTKDEILSLAGKILSIDGRPEIYA